MTKSYTVEENTMKRIASAVHIVEQSVDMIPRKARRRPPVAIPQRRAKGVVIRGIPISDGYELLVQRLKLNEEGVFETTGDVFSMPTWPFVPASFYRFNVFPTEAGDVPSLMRHICPTAWIGSVEAVLLWFPMAPHEAKSDDAYRAVPQIGGT